MKRKKSLGLSRAINLEPGSCTRLPIILIDGPLRGEEHTILKGPTEKVFWRDGQRFVYAHWRERDEHDRLMFSLKEQS